MAILEGIRKELPQHRNMEELQVTAAFVLGSAYYNTGAFRKAIDILVPALAQAGRMQLRYNTIGPHQVLAAAYDTLGNYRMAYRELQRKEALEDSLRTQAARVMNMMDVSLQTAERDKKNKPGSFKNHPAAT